MNIESFSGAASIALASTLVFILVAKSWQVLSRVIGGSPTFADGMVREAAQRFRDEFERLSNRQSILLGAGLVFAVLFAAAHVLNAERLFAGYPLWQLYIFLVALIAGAIVAAQRLVRTIVECHRVRLLRDANIAIGHQLQQIASGIGIVYHDVETPAGTIDHVIVGPNGAYAISVFARRPNGAGNVTLDSKQLGFEPAGKSMSVISISAKTAALEREFRRLLDHRVRVRSVIAVPGWQVSETSSEEHLLVNEQSLPTLVDWNDKADHLIDDDVDALHEMFTTRYSLKGQKAAIPADHVQ